MMARMTETTTQIERDQKNGRFLPGNSGNGGRKPGARGKFSDQFIQDLAAAWQDLGEQALRRVAIEEPAQFLRVCATLMPRDLNLKIGIDASDFADKFRSACELLGNPAPPRLRRPLRVINHAG